MPAAGCAAAVGHHARPGDAEIARRLQRACLRIEPDLDRRARSKGLARRSVGKTCTCSDGLWRAGAGRWRSAARQLRGDSQTTDSEGCAAGLARIPSALAATGGAAVSSKGAIPARSADARSAATRPISAGFSLPSSVSRGRNASSSFVRGAMGLNRSPGSITAKPSITAGPRSRQHPGCCGWQAPSCASIAIAAIWASLDTDWPAAPGAARTIRCVVLAETSSRAEANSPAQACAAMLRFRLPSASPSSDLHA